MPLENDRLTVRPIPAKYDRIYKARAGDADAIYEVNIARLECSCPEWQTKRAGFPADDARRICTHILEKLYSTKVEREFDLLLQLFIRYGRTLFSYRVVNDDLGLLLIGQPFGPSIVRVIGVVQEKPILATYDARTREWASGETDIRPEMEARLFQRIRAAFPQVVR